MMYTGATKKVKRPVARSFAPIPIPDPDPDPGMRGKKSLKKGAKTAAGAAAFQNRRKSASTRRPDGFKAAEAQAQEEKRRGSDGNVKKADGKAASGGEEALSRLTSRLGKEGKEMTAKMSEGEMNTLREICDILSGTRLRKVTFKDVAKGEIQRERDSKSRRDRAFASAITAYGRRNYERKEVHPEELELDLDEAIMFAQEKDKHSFKVKAAKAKYLMVFENRAKAEGKEGQGEGEGATAVEKDMKRKKKLRKTPGVWETTQAVKTLIKVKNEWMPHDWDRIMADLRKEGRDIASIDADLKEICRQSTREFGRTQTGKYLMPDDITWCRKHSRFSERDMLKWFRRYRQKCPKGSMSREAFQDLFRTVFPLSSTDVVADIVFEAYDAEKSGELDFKVYCTVLCTYYVQVSFCIL